MKNKIVRAILAGMLSVSMLLGNCSVVMAANPTKEETVFIKTDKTGKNTSVTVSDQLLNISGMKEIQDVSNLSDITNVKGDETFEQKGDKLVWKNEGSNEIVYQGTTKEELPIGISMNYELDGKKIKAEELKGKSGHLKVNVSYENRTRGKDYVPFLMMTVLVANEDKFTNIEVDNGREISDGERQTIIGFGVPGMKDYLKGSGVNTNELLKDVDIPEEFTVEADVTDYEDITCMSMAMNDIFTEEKIDSKKSLDKITNSMDELTDAANKLVDGSVELADGTNQLKNASGELVSGVNTLDNGGSAVAKGAGDLVDGVATLKDGAASLAEGTDKLSAGAKTLNDGVTPLGAGAHKLATGISGLKTGTGALTQLASTISGSIPAEATGNVNVEFDLNNAEVEAAIRDALTANNVVDSATAEAIVAQIKGSKVHGTVSATVPVNANTSAISAMAQQIVGVSASLATGVNDLETGATNLANSLDQLKTGANNLEEGLKNANAGAKQLAGGSDQIHTGASTLYAGATELSTGISTLKSGTGELVDGVNKLNNGAIELRDGMKKFNDEGIKKLDEIFGSDLNKLLNQMDSLKENAAGYKSCTGISENMDGTVKFIFVTE